MRYLIVAIVAILVIDQTSLTWTRTEAQSVTSSGIRRVLTTAGFCTGSGTIAAPLSCAVTTDGTSLSGTGSAGSAITYLLPSADVGAFGDGGDGVCAFDGSTTVVGHAPAANIYTLTKDIHCTTISISGSVTVKTNTWRLFAKTSLSNSGVISANGLNASGATAGAAITATSGGLVGGCAGATGSTAVGAVAPAGGTNTPRGWGVLGGGGGGGAGVSAGGASRALGTTYATTLGDIATVQNAIAQRSGNNTIIGNGLCGAVGGSAGGGGGAGTTGGGGGGGAPTMVVASPVWTGSGTVTANGGAGGNGSNSGTATGGGGGGKGGYVTLVYAYGAAPTATVSGGVKGLGSGGGVDGSNGTAGIVDVWIVGAQ